jgi:hypothetical protein
MTRIYYWQDAIGSPELLAQHAEAIHKLLSGTYTAADLEKLKTTNHATPIYSFRLNHKARLLFTTQQNYLLVLEYLPTHDYQKSRYLTRGGVIPHFDVAKQPPTLIQSSEPLNYQPVDYFDGKFIQLSTHQHRALQTSLPLIISGVAGSGKSFVALSLLRQILTCSMANKATRLVYVSKEPELVLKMQQTWHEFYAHTTDTPIEFMTYHAWLNQYQPLAERMPEDDAYYQAWCAGKKPATHGLDATTEFQEFRICSGLSLAQYVALGVHQSACPQDKRALVYQNFQRFMIEATVIDPMFYRLEQAPMYDAIVVDEAQNLSLIQQDNLYRLAKNHAVAFCMDSHQNLIDQCATQTLLESYYWTPEHRSRMNRVDLESTYRCSSEVVSVVNNLLHAQHAVMGKIEKQATVALKADDSLPAGAAYLTTPETIITEHANILQRATTTRFAVVTRTEYLEEACQLFKTPLVFTIEQIQGLGHHTVVVYKLWADEATRASLLRIHTCLVATNQQAVTSHRGKGEKFQLRELAPLFNQAYTAYTRAEHTLLICETPGLKRVSRHALLKWLVPEVRVQPSLAPATVVVPSTTADWDKERNRLAKVGQNTVANRITQQVSQDQARVLCIWQTLSKKETIFALTQRKDFLKILFEIDINTIPGQPAQSLFLSIIQSEQQLPYFIVAMNYGDWHSTGCIENIIQFTNLPLLLRCKLINYLFSHHRQHNHDTRPIKTWIAAQLADHAVREAVCQSLKTLGDLEQYITLLTDDDMVPLIRNADLIAFLSLHSPHINCHLFTVAMKTHYLRERISKRLPIAKPISTALWVEAFVYNDTQHFNKSYNNMSLLYYFCLFPVKFEYFFQHYPTIISAISPTHWITSIQTETGYATFPFYLLAMTEEGIKILTRLFDEHKAIFVATFGEAWARLIEIPRKYISTGIFSEPSNRLFDATSLVFALSTCKAGRTFIMRLFREIPDDIKRIPLNAWTHETAIRNFTKRTALINMMKSECGGELSRLLSDSHGELYQYILNTSSQFIP